MDLDAILRWLGDAGFPFRWRKEPDVGGKPAILRRTNGQQLPIGNLELGIVIPDVHLGFGGDVFQAMGGAAAHGQRLSGFLKALAALRDQVGADRFSVVQLGDWYDFYRSVGPTVAAQVAEIELAYAEVCAAAAALPVLHCIGNHDAALYENPHATKARFGIAQRLGSNAVMAFHGHDNKTLQAIQERDLGATIGLNILNLLALVPILGPLVNFTELLADDSFQEAWTKGNHGGDKPWRKAAGTPPPNWSAPWVARPDTAELVRAARGLEYLTDTALEVVLVGHSHRPGIASASITAERKVVLVDVGSWTYGRAEIAIVTRDGIGLAEIPLV